MKPKIMKNGFDLKELYPLEKRLVSNFGDINTDVMDRTYLSKVDLMTHIQSIKDKDTGNIFFATLPALLLIKDPKHTNDNVVPNYFAFTPKDPSQFNRNKSAHKSISQYSQIAQDLDKLFNKKLTGTYPQELYFLEEQLSRSWITYHLYYN